jgi:hypothetical protein
MIVGGLVGCCITSPRKPSGHIFIIRIIFWIIFYNISTWGDCQPLRGPPHSPFIIHPKILYPPSWYSHFLAAPIYTLFPPLMEKIPSSTNLRKCRPLGLLQGWSGRSLVDHLPRKNLWCFFYPLSSLTKEEEEVGLSTWRTPQGKDVYTRGD